MHYRMESEELKKTPSVILESNENSTCFQHKVHQPWQVNCATAALQVQSSAARGLRCPRSCCFSFQLQYTNSPLFIFAASSPFQSGRTLGNNKFHRALAFKKTRNMMQCSVRTLPPDHSEGETKGHTAPVFSEKETPKHFLEEFTTFLWLRDWFTPKNVL